MSWWENGRSGRDSNNLDRSARHKFVVVIQKVVMNRFLDHLICKGSSNIIVELRGHHSNGMDFYFSSCWGRVLLATSIHRNKWHTWLNMGKRLYWWGGRLICHFCFYGNIGIMAQKVGHYSDYTLMIYRCCFVFTFFGSFVIYLINFSFDCHNRLNVLIWLSFSASGRHSNWQPFLVLLNPWVL